MTITFWKDNRLDQEYRVNVQKIIADFIQSKHFHEYQMGLLFERAMLSHLASYGSFEFIHDNQWDEMKSIFTTYAMRNLYFNNNQKQTK